MRRSGADLEEKHEPLGRHLPTPPQTREKKRNEVRLLLTNAAIEKPSFVGAAANGGVELECAASSRHTNGSSGDPPSLAGPADFSVCNELGCGSSRKAVRVKSHRCFRSTSPACGRGSYRRSACAHRRVPLLVECEGLWRRHLRELRSCSSGAEWWALWLALAEARLPLMGLMTKTRLSALMTSSHLGEGNYEVAPGSAHPTNKNWRQS